jgi:hypothetical protein
VWDSDMIEVWTTMSFAHASVINGSLIISSQPFVIVNIYAPCDTAAKQELWDRLTTFIQNHGNENFCLCKYFNSIWSMDEIKGRGTLFRKHDSDIFNAFIKENLLVDLSF